MRETNGSEAVGYREGKIPEATVQRLSIYLRYVTQLHRDEIKVVSSYALSKGCGVKAAQVRKDFAYFGELGVRGVGYYVNDLFADLKKILGLEQVWEVALVGAGHLGSALTAYRGFEEYGFTISAIFDLHPEALPAALRERPHGASGRAAARDRQPAEDPDCDPRRSGGGSPGGSRRTGRSRGEGHLELCTGPPGRAARGQNPQCRPCG